MIENEQIAALWWRWWSNPFEGLHVDRLDQQFGGHIAARVQPNYKDIERLRMALPSLPSLPDDAMMAMPDKALVVLIAPDAIVHGLASLGCMALGDHILTARHQDWSDLHQIEDDSQIRELVSCLRELTPVLETIRLDLLAVLQSQLSQPISLKSAVTIVLGLYLREFSSSLYRRWLLTVSRQTEEVLAQVSRINKEHVNEFLAWVDLRLGTVIEHFKMAYDIPMVDFSEYGESHVETA